MASSSIAPISGRKPRRKLPHFPTEDELPYTDGDNSFLPEIDLPTEDDLPHTDGEQVMESEVHAMQLPLMKEPLKHHWKDRTDFFIGTNMYVYYSKEQVLTKDYKGPDVFVALGVSPRTRKSFMLWNENKGPDVIIEFLSSSTASIDKGHKKQVYQDILRVPEYFWCDPETDEFAGFALTNGRYVAIKPDKKGMLPSKRLGLALTRWQGVHEGVEANWLRWATPEGVVLPTSDERAQAQFKRANRERKRADALAELLKKHGIDPAV